MSINTSAISNAPVKSNLQIDQQVVDYGFEVEQPNGDNRGIILNPNPRNLKIGWPDAVVRRSSQVPTLHAHADQSGPWEVVLGHSPRLSVLKDTFDSLVGNDIFAWCANFKRDIDGEIEGCGPHVHMSLIGHKNLGDGFDDQKTLGYGEWTILYNTWVSMLPFIAPFFKFGKNFRVSGLNDWCKPVYDRFSVEDTKQLFELHNATGSLTGTDFDLDHDYNAISWNQHCKKQVTLEIRLNENHPYFVLPALQLMASIVHDTIARGWSVKPLDPVIHATAWRSIADNGVYQGLLKVKNVSFPAGRGIPHVMRDDQEKTFDTGLDLFRSLCRRFVANGKKDNPIRFGKVMRMYSDFIAVENLPTHLVWNIDELYHQLYEVPDAKRNQDAWLHFGSRVVLPEKERLSSRNTVSKLIHG